MFFTNQVIRKLNSKKEKVKTLDSPVAVAQLLPRASVVFVFLPSSSSADSSRRGSRRLRPKKTLLHSNLLPSSSEIRSSTKRKALASTTVARSSRVCHRPPQSGLSL
ncbi:uncharacterized protein DS421_20g690190 [Arachis hypogaea]|nr:uncharacterized protein DS421_20g690190 [Arachis hypogaea]